MIVDTNVNLSRWPFRRLPGDETSDLVARLRKRNVAQAWAGSFDGILYKDIGGVNARLVVDCKMALGIGGHRRVTLSFVRLICSGEPVV